MSDKSLSKNLYNHGYLTFAVLKSVFQDIEKKEMTIEELRFKNQLSKKEKNKEKEIGNSLGI